MKHTEPLLALTIANDECVHESLVNANPIAVTEHLKLNTR